MSRGRPKDLTKIKEDLEKRLKLAVQEIAQKVVYEIQEAYNTVIDNFYNDEVFPVYNNKSHITTYTNIPHSYKRTESLYVGSSGAYNLYTDNIVDYGNYIETGISVSGQYITWNPYRADTDWVFSRAYFEGIHGFYMRDNLRKNKFLKRNQMFKIKKKLSRLNRGTKTDETKLKISTLQSELSELQNKYSEAVFAPKKSSPPPEKRMQNLFKKITKEKHLKEISDEIIGKHLRI